MIKAAIFDIDGTVLDSMPMWNEFSQKYLEAKGIEAEPDLGKKLFHMTPEQSSDYIIQKYSLKKTVAELTAEMREIAYHFYADQVELKPGIIPILDALREHGIGLGVATVSDRNAVEAGLTRNHILDYFSAIVTVEDVGIGKEDPEVFLEAARQLNAAAAESCVFEDALHAVETAKMAGFITVGVYEKTNLHFQEELIRQCDFFLRENADLDDLLNFLGI